MNRRVLLGLLVILFVVGAVVLNSVVKQKQLTVAYSTTGSVDSRQKEIMVKVSDQNNGSISNVAVRYEQISQDFLYNVGEYWDAGAKEAGTNTMGIYLDWGIGENSNQTMMCTIGVFSNKQELLTSKAN